MDSQLHKKQFNHEEVKKYIYDKDMKEITGLKRRYRRCRENMTTERKPWCYYHYMKQNDDPDKDPQSKESKKDKGGHGSGNSTGVPNAPSTVLGGRK